MEASIRNTPWQMNQFNVVDKTGAIIYQGHFESVKNFLRLALAKIDEVSEQDEVQYSNILNELKIINWIGKLKVVPNTEYLSVYIGDFQSWLNWCNKNNRLLKTLKQ